MKKLLTVLLVAVMTLSLCACNGGNGEQEPATEPLHLWETASTDIVDFSIDDAEFTIYASATHNSTYLEPVEEKTYYGAPTGKTIVVISFTVDNKDRAETLSIGDPFGGDNNNVLNLDWKLKYNGQEYSLSGLEGGRLDMSPGAIIDRDTQRVIEEITSSNHLLFSGRCESYRVAGIVDFEPESLDDKFEIAVSIPDSKDKYTEYTYVTEYAENQGEIFYQQGMNLLNREEYFYAMEKFEMAGDFPGAQEGYEEAELMYYLEIPTYQDAPDYFKKNKDNYTLLNGQEIADVIVGEWSSSTDYGNIIIFREDGIIENQYISDGTWKVSGDYLEYCENDKSEAYLCEVRKVNDGIYLLYKDGEEAIASLQSVE